jgi:hypothetical protein
MATQNEIEKYYRAIGFFVSAFSNLELELKADITIFLGLTFGDGRRILSHDFAMTCTIAESVLSSRAGDDGRSAELRKLIKACRALNDHRVKIVHGFWTLDDGRMGVGYLSRRSLKIEPHYKTHQEITKLADEAERLAMDLGKWVENLPPEIRPRRWFEGHEE